MRVLYFDIDGALLDWYDRPKPGLRGGGFQELLVARRFDALVCVSGWADMVQMKVSGIPREMWGTAIHRLVAPLFPDVDWFLNHLTLGSDTDHRGRLIQQNFDWFYVDDNADRFFTEEFGEDSYRRHLGSRICCPHHSSDGSEVFDWLSRIPVEQSDAT